ncbi:MAG: histidine kinase [Methylocystis sp.]|nr:histidine kinase [Methylocystis sp.]
MLQRLSLRARLSLLLGAVLAVALALGVGLLVLHAGARVRAETDVAMRLARELIEARLPQITAASDPRTELARLLSDDAARLRHVRVWTTDTRAPPQTHDARAPEWFSALALPKSPETRIEAPGATIVIAANPADEIAEIWQEIVALAIGGAAIALVAFLLVSYAVSRTLRPVATLVGALARLEQGDHGARAPVDGSPELATIAERINALAATLERLDEENHRLLRRMIHVQDEERRDIARDLHDEIGPALFTVRAGVGAMARKAAAPGADSAKLAEDCARIDAQIAALQQVNRRILGRLRPAALDEMGLADALRALAQGWRETNPDIALDLSLEGAEGKIGEKIALAAYRVVQEALANAYRHSGATRIGVDVDRDDETLRIKVRDNGAGIAKKGANGLGLRGMSERLGALGGALELQNLPEGGTLLTATLPLIPDSARE